MVAPKVSIVIPVYNGADYLAQAIDSVLEQTWKNLEIIVINDGSNDNDATEQITQSYGDRIRYINKPNGGVASALNVGIANMTGEYFSWLSHDDLYLPNKIRHQMRILNMIKDPYQIVDEGYYIADADKHLLDIMDVYSLYPKEKLEFPLFPVFLCAVNGCTLLIHRRHVERVGVFDESLPMTQDYDLWFRLLKDQSLVYIRTIGVVSRVHDQQTSYCQAAEHKEECERLWLWLLHTLT